MTQKEIDAIYPVADNRNPSQDDRTYRSLHEQNRVVMRHQIALNIDTFRAAPDEFVPRPTGDYPPLAPETPPFISVIIPNYNGMRFLPTVLAALAEQSFSDFEIIIADDASHDDSVAWVEEHYPDVRVLCSRRNRGFVASCNAAAAAARGRVLVLLNSDTEPEPAWLGELARAICANPQAAMVTSKMLLFDRRDTLHTTGDQLGADGIPRNRGVWEVDRGQYDDAPAIFSVNGGGSAYRKDVWDALGGFDEDFWMYIEDVDFAFRAQMLGWDAVFVPTARLYHHLSATSGDTLASYYVGRNIIWNIAKNMPRSLLTRNAPRIAAAQARITLDALRHIRGEAARARLRGQIAGLRGLPRQLQKRKLVQVRRITDDRVLGAKLS